MVRIEAALRQAVALRAKQPSSSGAGEMLAACVGFGGDE